MGRSEWLVAKGEVTRSEGARVDMGEGGGMKDRGVGAVRWMLGWRGWRKVGGG